MRNPRRSIFSPTFGAAVSVVAILNDQAFSILKDQVRGPDGFEAGGRRCAALSERMGVDAESVRLVLQTVGYMYDQIHVDGDRLDPKEVRDVIARDVEAEEEVDHDLLHSRLEDVLGYDAGIEAYRRERDLKTGFLRRAVGFSTALDLRPDVDDEAGSSRLIPLVQFRVHLAGAGDGSDPVVFQVDARALDELESTVQDVRERLGSLRRDPRFGRAITE